MFFGPSNSNKIVSKRNLCGRERNVIKIKTNEFFAIVDNNIKKNPKKKFSGSIMEYIERKSPKITLKSLSSRFIVLP